MNEFTKDELEELLMWSNHLAGCSPSLLNKLKSLIDNYCEPLSCAEVSHNWEFIDHGSAGYYECSVCKSTYNEKTGAVYK